jgi:hypothetical protein
MTIIDRIESLLNWWFPYRHEQKLNSLRVEIEAVKEDIDKLNRAISEQDRDYDKLLDYLDVKYIDTVRKVIKKDSNEIQD